MKDTPPLSASPISTSGAPHSPGGKGTRSPRAIGCFRQKGDRAQPRGGASSDTRRRSLLKAVTWRLIAVSVLGVVSRVITGSWREAEIITAVYSVVAVVLFYTHERIWQRIDWGKR